VHKYIYILDISLTKQYVIKQITICVEFVTSLKSQILTFSAVHLCIYFEVSDFKSWEFYIRPGMKCERFISGSIYLMAYYVRVIFN